MGFWSWLKGESAAESGVAFRSGDPDGLEVVGEEVESRALPVISPSPWDGWPSSWGVPGWSGSGDLDRLVDTAWAGLDLNSSVLSAMPAYKLRNGEVVEPEPWMINPDPTIYSSWSEFAKELFWDFQMGEVFVRAVTWYASGYPSSFRVVPSWAVEVEMGEFGREYRIAGRDVTGEILHIRYKSSTASARGVGPLEAGGARMTTAGVLGRYVTELARLGGRPTYTLETPDELEPEDAQDLLRQWVASRQANLGAPPVLDRNVTLKSHPSMSPRDMAMLEVAQFTESRIAVLLGVPPFLLGLPSGGDSMTYSNVSSLFDFHDRASLRPKATAVMSALSAWALPRGSSVELNRDEYSRPAFGERADSYVKLLAAGVLSVDEVRQMERLTGQAPAAALGGVL